MYLCNNRMQWGAFWEYFCGIPNVITPISWGAGVTSNILWFAKHEFDRNCQLAQSFLVSSLPTFGCNAMKSQRKQLTLHFPPPSNLFYQCNVGNTNIIIEIPKSLAVFENHWPSSSSLKKADLKCVAKCLRKIIGDSKVCDSNNVKSAMYHLAINFSDKLHNSRFSQPTITRNNTLNIDETGRPKIDKSNGYCTWILHIYFALKTPLTTLFCT